MQNEKGFPRVIYIKPSPPPAGFMAGYYCSRRNFSFTPRASIFLNIKAIKNRALQELRCLNKTVGACIGMRTLIIKNTGEIMTKNYHILLLQYILQYFVLFRINYSSEIYPVFIRFYFSVELYLFFSLIIKKNIF